MTTTATPTTATVRHFTADELGYYPDDPHREDAAALASRLIDTARRDGALFGHPLADAEHAAAVIAELVQASHPDVGATDTVCREAFYEALTGQLDPKTEEAEKAEAIRSAQSAPLVEGQPGWGIRRQQDVGFWVEMGRSIYGPFDSIKEARSELIAEASGRTVEEIKADAVLRQVEAAGSTLTDPDPEDVELDQPAYTGTYGFRSGKVKVGDAVAVTFYDGRRPLFGYVREVRLVADSVDFALVDDVEYGARGFAIDSVSTVTVLKGRTPKN